MFEEVILGEALAAGDQDLKLVDVAVIVAGVMLWFSLFRMVNKKNRYMLVDFFFMGYAISWACGKILNYMERCSRNVELGVEKIQVSVATRIGISGSVDFIFMRSLYKKSILIFLVLGVIVYILFKLSSLNGLLTTNRFTLKDELCRKLAVTLAS